MSNGRIGLNFNIMTSNGKFTLNCVSDQAIYKNPKHMIDIWENIMKAEMGESLKLDKK